MSLYNFINEKIILSLSDLILNHHIKKHLSFLKKSQWWSYEDLESFQLERFKRLLEHSYNNVSYYKELFSKHNIIPSDIKSLNDIKQLPILKKENIKKNFPNEIFAINISKKNCYYNFSSGSTGEPVQYYITKDAYCMNIACNLRGWYWMGFRLGDKYAKITQGARDNFLKRLQDFTNRAYIFPYLYTKENFKLFVKYIRLKNIHFLRSYPDPLLFFASNITKEDKLPKIRAINTTGNILFKEIRDLIENKFKTRIYDSYSCEGGANVFECKTHNCYHSSMEYGITEIIDNDGNEVKPGEKGRLITTDLWNFSTPFIRYDSQDIVVKSEKKCSCGRNLLSITKIEGRNNDILITEDGNMIIAQTFTNYFKKIAAIDQFQVKQDTINDIKFLFGVNKLYNNKLEMDILSYWSKRIKNVKFEIEVVKDIPLLPSGKRRFLVRNPEIPLDLIYR